MISDPSNEHREQARQILRRHAIPVPFTDSITSTSNRTLAEDIAVALSSRDTEVREVLEGLLPFVQKVAALTCSRTMGAEGDVCGFYERDVNDFCAACHAETLLTDDGLQLRGTQLVP